MSMRTKAPPSLSPSLDVDTDGIALVTFDDPDRRVNLLTEPVMERLEEIVADLESRIAGGEVRGVLFRSTKPKHFIAGADVNAIAAIDGPDEGADAARRGQALYLAIERLSVPTAVAISGTCMGGGTELGLACTYRFMTDDPDQKIGLPEVQLGILPAWGGTTRLPRLIGLQSALDLLLTGKTLGPDRARRKGLVDDLLPAEEFNTRARDLLLERMEEGPVSTGARRSFLQRLAEDTAPGRAVILRTARGRVLDKSGGHYPAPLRILDVLSDSLGLPVEKALEVEAEAAGELIASRVSHSLIHVFRLREAARKSPSGPEPRTTREMGVIGAGVMGGGIAQLAAYNGIRVRMRDLQHEAIAGGLQHARSLFDKAVDKRKLTHLEADQAMDRISGGVGGGGFGQLDVAIEAVVERLDVKREVLAGVEAEVPEEAILTTNTSTLSVDDMAEVLERPEAFAGFHFFNPVHRMPLVEIVRGSRTSQQTLNTLHALALTLGKVPVIVGDGPGFLVNRILGPYLNEAGHLLAEGASVQDIDGAATEFGLPMGPLRLVDEVGIDIATHAGAILHEAFGDRMSPSAPLVALGESDRLGRKGGLGFYRYEDGREAEVDPNLDSVLGSARSDTPRDLPVEDIRARLILAMMNEAARVLEEGIATTAADVDLAMIMGTGFPPFRGGLLRFADQLHPRIVVERLREYETSEGMRFKPAPLLVDLARGDGRFYEAFPLPERS